MPYRILHNPRCSKSRAALALLEQAGLDIEIIRYLDTPPSAAELTAILAAIDVPPAAVVRRKEARELGLAPIAADSDAAYVAKVLAAHPQAIERPIVVAPSGAAVLGRPPENITALL
ncbi:MAG: ArsC/Spx/MgsR family protein [Pseudomonadota bacterium]